MLFSAPQVRELQQRHSGHPDKLQRALAALREREGTGIFAGCLPLLLQLPFFSVMYRLFLSPAVAGRPNGLLGHTLLGAPLGGHWLSGPGPLSAQGLVFAGLYLLYHHDVDGDRAEAAAPQGQPAPCAETAAPGRSPGWPQSRQFGMMK